MEFKDKLKKLRKEANLSQEALADLVHISRSAIAKYENGNGNPSEDTLKALAFYFGVEIEELKSDTIIKKQNKKKRVLKYSFIAGSLLLITCLTVGLICLFNNNETNVSESISSSENVSESVSSSENVSESISSSENVSESISSSEITTTNNKQIYYNVKLLNSDDPVYTVLNNNTYSYIVTTYLSFDITFYDKEDDSSLSSQDITFEKQTFANVHYNSENTNNEASYKVSFKKNGEYKLNFSVDDFNGSINFIVDDENEQWNKYKVSPSTVFPWISEVTNKNINKLRYEYANASLDKEIVFKDIYYSNESSDIANAYNFLHKPFIMTNYIETKEGGGTTKLKFYYNESNENEIFVVDNYLATTSSNYMLTDPIPAPINKNACEHRYAFNWSNPEIIAIKKDDNTQHPLDFFYDLEFITWPPDMDDGGNISNYIYKIENYAYEPIYIYDATRFLYNGNMYLVLSEQNFSSLFE